MRPHVVWILLMCAAGLLIGAQQMTHAQNQLIQPPPGPIAAQATGELRSGMVRGRTVVGRDGKEVGSFDEFLFTPSGQITAVVIDVGGFLGMGARTIALPFSAVQFTAQDDGKIISLHVPLGANDVQLVPTLRYLKRTN